MFKIFKKEQNIVVCFQFDFEAQEYLSDLKDLLSTINGGIYPRMTRWYGEILDTDFTSVIGNRPFISLEYFFIRLGIGLNKINYAKFGYGWDDLSQAKVKITKYGILLEMPKLKKLLPNELYYKAMEKMFGI